MRVRLLRVWESVRTTYWFIPGLMSLACIGLAFLTGAWDVELSQREAKKLGFLWVGGPEGARQVLSTIASSMITVAGVTFSITIVALVQASSQFGPRLLRNFMRDTGNQVVLGTFVGTYVYCLLVLRTVQEIENKQFVPHLSVTCALGLALASLAVLIYYIHHISDSIQAENIAANVGRELIQSIKAQFSEKGVTDEHASAAKGENKSEKEWKQSVCARSSGYLQAVDTESLLQLAETEDLVLLLSHHAGDFVSEGATIVYSSKPLREKQIVCVQKTFILGRRRTPTQDIDFQVHQLVEVAVRALSPGINDPFTAITCVDWLGAALLQVQAREMPSGEIKGKSGKVRLLVKPPSFQTMFYAAFNQIRQNTSKHVAVSIRLLETFEILAENAKTSEQLTAIAAQAVQVQKHALAELQIVEDRQVVEERFGAVMTWVNQRGEQLGKAETKSADPEL